VTTAAHADAFGLTLEAGWMLPGFLPGPSSREVDVTLEPATHAAIDASWSGSSEPPLWRVLLDAPLRLEAGRAGDHLFSYGDGARAHLSGGRERLLCAPAEEADPGWLRALLDSVLLCTALLHGRQPLHAAGIGFGDDAVAIVGATGGGKTSLAWELLGRGATLLADDLVVLTVGGGRVVAHPGPPLMNLPAERAPEPLGHALAQFPREGEQWVQLAAGPARPLPLRAIVLLERLAGSADSCERIDPTPFPLLPRVPFLDGSADAARERFEIIAAVAALVPMYRLMADTRRSPSELADLLHDQLADDGVVGPAASTRSE
jgi:hypothetical protein